MHVFDTDIVDHIEVKMIRPSVFLIRNTSTYSHEVGSLTLSIKEHGLLQPILIRPYQNKFEIVAGHRRFYACKSLRWYYIPCQIRELTDKQAFEIQLTENIQRNSLDVLEEAESFRKYVQELGWGGVTDLAKKIGKSEEYVSHRMQLLKLPKEIKEKIMVNKLSVSQALELTTISSNDITQLADQIINDELTIRQIRKIKATNYNKHTQNSAFEKIASHNYTSKNMKTIKITKKTALTLKITLTRLDRIIEEVNLYFEPEQCKDILNFLMNLRLKVHSLIDETIRFKNMKTGRTF